MNKNLAKPPKYTRFSGAKGIKSENPVSRKGGDYGAGMIRAFAVITRGEALGHDAWIDRTFLHQVAEQINASENGRKSRFTHPGLSSDGLAKFLGRTKNAFVDGDTVRADQHFAKSSHRTPDGDLAGYLMDRASEDPESFGASIVFEHDPEAEDAFHMANGGDELFVSPDPLNTRNLPHVRLRGMRAVDLVDEPAANPSGLFHREQEIATEAEALVAYALGVTKQKPAGSEQFGMSPDRAATFVNSFLKRHGLEVVPSQQEALMPPEEVEDEVVPTLAEPTPTEPQPAETPAEAPVEEEPELSVGAKFLAAFGNQGGVWFAQGKRFEEATQLHIAALTDKVTAQQSEIESFQKQLKALRGEATPVDFSAEHSVEQEALAAKVNVVGSLGLAAYAASLNVGKK